MGLLDRLKREKEINEIKIDGEKDDEISIRNGVFKFQVINKEDKAFSQDDVKILEILNDLYEDNGDFYGSFISLDLIREECDDQDGLEESLINLEQNEMIISHKSIVKDEQSYKITEKGLERVKGLSKIKDSLDEAKEDDLPQDRGISFSNSNTTYDLIKDFWDKAEVVEKERLLIHLQRLATYPEDYNYEEVARFDYEDLDDFEDFLNEEQTFIEFLEYKNGIKREKRNFYFIILLGMVENEGEDKFLGSDKINEITADLKGMKLEDISITQIRRSDFTLQLNDLGEDKEEFFKRTIKGDAGQVFLNIIAKGNVELSHIKENIESITIIESIKKRVFSIQANILVGEKLLFSQKQNLNEKSRLYA